MAARLSGSKWGGFLLTLLAMSEAASLQKVADVITPNPTKVGFYIYVPDTLPSDILQGLGRLSSRS
jgi:hypothetical protein